jgi:hypothetical protein
MREVLDACGGSALAAVDAGLIGAIADATAVRPEMALDEDITKARRNFLVHERAFSARFMASLQVEIQRSLEAFISGASIGEAAGAAPVGQGLKLVRDDDMELRTRQERIAAWVRNASDNSFEHLRGRLARLCGDRLLRENEVPFGGAMCVAAAAAALGQLNLEPRMVTLILGLLEAPLVRLGVAAIRAADRELETLGIDPFEAFGPGAPVPVRAGGGVNHGRPPTLTDTQIVRARPQTLIGPPQDRGRLALPSGSLALSPDGQRALQALLERIPSDPVAAEGVPAQPRAVTDDLTAVVVRDLLRMTTTGAARQDSALLDRIDDVLHMAASALAGAAAGRAPALARGPALDADPQRLAVHAQTRAEKLTIELIALLFDRIRRDPHLLGEVKALVLQLHMPMLRLALVDTDRFVDPQAAPRRLLDRIAATAVGWTPEGDENRQYLAEVRGAVLTVLQSESMGIAPFEQALARFDAFVNALYTRDDDAVTRARRALEEAEQQEIQVIRATIKVRAAFDGVPIESYLREFLLDNWVRVLVAAAHREREQPGVLQKMVDVVPDLVWTVQPKIATEDRRRMLDVLPDVLAKLREGLSLCEWPPGHMDGFLQQLMTSHAMAVKAIELAHGRQRFEPSALRRRLNALGLDAATEGRSDDGPPVPDDVLARALAQRKAPVDHLAAPTDGRGTAVMSIREAEKVVADLARGGWFDLTVDKRKLRVRLNWISPRRSLFLFSQSRGTQAQSLTADALVRFVAAGRLTTAEPAPLFERAMGAVLRQMGSRAPA